MSRFHLFTFCSLALLVWSGAAPSARGQSGDPYMGDYEGKFAQAGGENPKIVAQVIALGKGEYQANLLNDFDRREPTLVMMKGKESNGKVVFNEGKWNGQIESAQFTGSDNDKVNQPRDFGMKKVSRVSPTMGAKPPEDALVLFDGKSFDQWQGQGGKPVGWKLVEGDAAEVVPKSGSILTEKKFGDLKLHLEFRTPFMPEKRGQARGNSGVYFNEAYEVQVLDSYGLEGLDNECGGIYKVAKPRVNMCAPPLQWQTYDVTFRAPRFDDKGNKTRSVRITVIHNGVTIHDNLEIPGPTGAAKGKSKGDPQKPGSILLQDHGNLVQYRNIWVEELKN